MNDKTKLKLCTCCQGHPEEADIENKLVICVVCGEECQCDGCIAEYNDDVYEKD
jgi:hypothetical protein